VKPLHPISIDSSAVEQSAIRKIAMRLVPFIALMFFINYLDRTAISFAGPNGVAEAGFFPGAILFLSMWVPAEDRSKIFSLFYLAQPLTTVLGRHWPVYFSLNMELSASQAGDSCIWVLRSLRSWWGSSRGFTCRTARQTPSGFPRRKRPG
jgi:MFS family permease